MMSTIPTTVVLLIVHFITNFCTLSLEHFCRPLFFTGAVLNLPSSSHTQSSTTVRIHISLTCPQALQVSFSLFFSWLLYPSIEDIPKLQAIAHTWHCLQWRKGNHKTEEQTADRTIGVYEIPRSELKLKSKFQLETPSVIISPHPPLLTRALHAGSPLVSIHWRVTVPEGRASLLW